MSDMPPRVLVVDDDAGFARMVADVLLEAGYRAEAVSDPREALERAADPDLAAAVIDRVMPGLDGLEVAGRIKARNPEVEVVILTGHPDLESAMEGVTRGIFAYLDKATLQIARLEWAVQRAVEKARLTRSNRELLTRLQESNRLLAALHQVSAELSAEPHLDRLLGRLVAAAKELCQAGAARALLLETTAGGERVVRACAGDGCEGLRGARLRPDEGLLGLALTEGRAVVAEDAARHPRYSERSDSVGGGGLICAPLAHGAVEGALMVAGDGFQTELGEAVATLARHAAVAVDNAQHQERAANFFTHASELLVSFLEAMDADAQRGHSRAVAALCDMVTRRLGLSEAERRDVHFGALLHDLGKVKLPPEVLRAAPLSVEARRLIQQHPALGAELLRPISLFAGVLSIIHAHHERWDGSGYPRGLAGEEIPLGARVVAVADAFEAMTSHRFGPLRTAEEALAELQACAGSQFDPKVVRLFAAEYRQQLG